MLSQRSSGQHCDSSVPHTSLVTSPNSLTEIRIFSRFSSVGNCGISFCTTLLNASKMLWSYIDVKWKLRWIWSKPAMGNERGIQFILLVQWWKRYAHQYIQLRCDTYMYIHAHTLAECARLWENTPYVKLHWHSQKHLYFKFNSYRHNGKRSTKESEL